MFCLSWLASSLPVSICLCLSICLHHHLYLYAICIYLHSSSITLSSLSPINQLPLFVSLLSLLCIIYPLIILSVIYILSSIICQLIDPFIHPSIYPSVYHVSSLISLSFPCSLCHPGLWPNFRTSVPLITISATKGSISSSLRKRSCALQEVYRIVPYWCVRHKLFMSRYGVDHHNRGLFIKIKLQTLQSYMLRIISSLKWSFSYANMDNYMKSVYIKNTSGCSGGLQNISHSL